MHWMWNTVPDTIQIFKCNPILHHLDYIRWLISSICENKKNQFFKFLNRKYVLMTKWQHWFCLSLMIEWCQNRTMLFRQLRGNVKGTDIHFSKWSRENIFSLIFLAPWPFRLQFGQGDSPADDPQDIEGFWEYDHMLMWTCTMGFYVLSLLN